MGEERGGKTGSVGCAIDDRLYLVSSNDYGVSVDELVTRNCACNSGGELGIADPKLS